MPRHWLSYIGDLSSISGSDSSEAEESLAVSATREESECDSNWCTSATSGSPLVTFSSGDDQALAVYRCVLTASKVCFQGWCGRHLYQREELRRGSG